VISVALSGASGRVSLHFADPSHTFVPCLQSLVFARKHIPGAEPESVCHPCSICVHVSIP
jgi:hypothetical protein